MAGASRIAAARNAARATASRSGAFAMKLWLAREERLRTELSETAAELAGGAEVPAALT